MPRREHGLTFTTHLVQAILADEKNVTRRLSKPRAKVGDLIDVKETFAFDRFWNAAPTRDVPVGARVIWKAGPLPRDPLDWRTHGRWRSSRFMPKRLARIWLEVLDVRREKLQDITVTDVAKEGVRCLGETTVTPLDAFRLLWDEINSQAGRRWDDNPDVYRIEFRKVEHNAAND